MKSNRTLLASVVALAAVAMASVKSFAIGLGEKVNEAVAGFMSNQGLMLFATTRTPVHTGVLPIRNQPTDQGIYEMPVPFDFPAANPTVNDILALCKVPAGVDIVDWALIVNGQVDSNGAPALAYTLGSLTSDLSNISTAYATGLTAGRGASGDVARAANGAPLGEGSAAARDIGIKWTAAAATYVAGKKGVLILRVRG